MCVIFFAYESHPQYRLIVAANRDEYYNRPTQSAQFWMDEPNVLAGRDLEQMGTWLGVTKTGRFAALTNYREPKSIAVKKAKSRGHLVSDFLCQPDLPQDYLNKIRMDSESYNGFNLLVGDLSSLWYYSKIMQKSIKIESGIYGLSNDQLNTPWPKVNKGKSAFNVCIQSEQFVNNPGSLFDLLSDADVARDEELPDTGVGLDWERTLSPVFIQSEHYGTRCSTIVLIDYQGHVIFIERERQEDLSNWKETTYEFDII